jgi:hypothetical protein
MIKPKVILIVFGIVVFLFILFSSSAVHEFVHFVEDGFSNPNICFVGYYDKIDAPLHIVGLYESGSVSSEFLAYLVQFVFAVPLLFFGWFGFARVYRKL